MTSFWRRLILLLAGFSILASLACWAYATATPWVYPDLLELLFEPYDGAARPGDRATMVLRGASALLIAAAVALPALWMTVSGRHAFLAGVVGALFLALPPLVPWVLQSDLRAGLLTAFLYVPGAFALLVVLRRFPALALPLASLLLLAGVMLSVRSAAQVTLWSTPPLHVLERSVRQPQSPHAQLGLAMHLLSLGGPEAAGEELRQAGRLLLASRLAATDARVREVAQQLADFGQESHTDPPSSEPPPTRDPASS